MRNVPVVTVGVLALTVALAGAHARADGSPADLWSDPEFKKQFLGTYGINREVEPGMTPEERALLERIYPLMSSDPDTAARQIEAARKPDSTALLDYVLGGIAFQKSEFAEAASHYQDAATKFPSFRRAWKMLGVTSYQQQRYDEAIQAFGRMIQLGGADALSFGLLGDAYSARKDPLSAESAYRSALLLEPQNAAYRIGLVRSVLEQAKYEEAVGLLDVLIEKSPDRVEFWLLQANAFVHLRQPLKAAENFEVVARMGKATADSMNVLGDIYLNEGLPQLGVAAYERALDLEPPGSLSRPLKNIEALLARGATDEARMLLARVRDAAAGTIDEEQERRLLGLQARIAIAQGRGDEAAGILEETISLDPLDGDALLLLGQHYQRAGDAEKALVYYGRAGNLEVFEAAAKARAGQLLAAQGKYDEALPLLERARELKPSDQLALYIEQVERLARTGR